MQVPQLVFQIVRGMIPPSSWSSPLPRTPVKWEGFSGCSQLKSLSFSPSLSHSLPTPFPCSCVSLTCRTPSLLPWDTKSANGWGWGFCPYDTGQQPEISIVQGKRQSLQALWCVCIFLLHKCILPGRFAFLTIIMLAYKGPKSNCMFTKVKKKRDYLASFVSWPQCGHYPQRETFSICPVSIKVYLEILIKKDVRGAWWLCQLSS